VCAGADGASPLPPQSDDEKIKDEAKKDDNKKDADKKMRRRKTRYQGDRQGKEGGERRPRRDKKEAEKPSCQGDLDKIGDRSVFADAARNYSAVAVGKTA